MQSKIKYNTIVVKACNFYSGTSLFQPRLRSTKVIGLISEVAGFQGKF